MKIITFLIENWSFILLIALAVAAVVFAVFKRNKSVVMRMLVALVTEAEKEFGGGTGSLKLASVIGIIYPKLPTIVKTFITDKMLVKWIEDALKRAKEEWEKNGEIAKYIKSAEG